MSGDWRLAVSRPTVAAGAAMALLLLAYALLPSTPLALLAAAAFGALA